MIVLDASALIELLCNTQRGAAVAARIAPESSLHAPHLLDLEIVQALRRLVAQGELDPGRAGAALDDLLAMDLERHAHEVLIARIWELRHNLTPYDAAYVALAEALAAPLLTCDAPLSHAPGNDAAIECV